jgi:hypothetical protein
MRPKKIILSHLLAITMASMVAFGADDVQVIESKKSVLSIYGYGGSAETRVAPEISDGKRLRRRRTGSLTDVVSTPPLSTSISGKPPSSKFSSGPNTRMMSAPTSGTTSSFTPSDVSGTSSTDLTRIVTVAWDPSPDQSVVGYQVYTGSASGQYSSKQSVADLTSAQISVNQDVLYVAVSAYTAEGLESRLSAEVVVTNQSQQSTGPAGLIGSGQ